MPLYLKDKLVSGTGATGKSAYQAAVDAGYTGTETSFNQALTSVPGHIADTKNPHGVTAAQAGAVASIEKGAANGVATLGADGKLAGTQVPLQQIMAVTNAAEYSAAATYAAGAYCTKDGKLYRCMVAISTAEAWNAAHWEETTMGAELVKIYVALADKAPAGYGIGDNVAVAPVNSDGYADANLITKTGFYRAFAHTPLGGWHYITHEEYSGGTAFQIGFYGTSATIAVRRKLSSVWKDWEYVNPPLELGREYPTTERYLGKPVYVKMIQAGFNPAGTVKTTSDKTVSASGLVRFSAVSGAWSFPSFMYGGNYTDDGDIQVAVQATSDGIYVFTWSKIRDMTSRTANVSVYYTKD